MNPALKPLRWLLLWPAMTGVATAQQPPSPAPEAPVTQSSKATAQSEAGEPRADTSRTAAMPAESAANAQPAMPAAAPPTPSPSRAGRIPAAARPTATGQKSTAVDRLELGVATVTGDREQPKVMYIVPWKKSDIGDLSGKPMNSLLDEALAPVDRDEFKREVVYYSAVKADASQNGASRPPAKQGEK
jgi:hypothetical protein